MMNLQPPARAALGDSVADILRSGILDGSLKPGQPLHENTLARQLAVSRSPIREALILLERERLVVARANRPVVVRRPSAAEIREVYTIRASLEGIAARWAAEHATPAFVARLTRQAEALNRATLAARSQRDPKVAALALDFHSAILEAAGSDELRRMLQSLCNQIRLAMTAGLASLSGRRAEEIHAEHLELVAAIAARDGDRAERLATQHVLGARERLVHLGDAAVER